MTELTITVLSTTEWRANGAYDVVDKGRVFMMDDPSCPLAMPGHIRIGGETWDGQPILGYSSMVDEYEVWLEDQVRDENIAVMVALDAIFEAAQNGGAWLVTSEQPTPFRTNAHVVKAAIERLAQGLNQRGEG